MALDKQLLDNVFSKSTKKAFAGSKLTNQKPLAPKETQPTEKVSKYQLFDKIPVSETETSDKPRTTQESAIKPEQVILNNFSSLVGLQKRIVQCLYEECKLARAKTTNPITIEHITSVCETTRLSAQKSIQRLEKKAIVIRKRYKPGRGGWTCYELPDHIYQEILHEEQQLKLRTNLGQKVEAKLPQQEREEPETALPEDWQIINYDVLTSIGFSEHQLRQLQGKNTPEVVQQSLNHFAFGLENNKKVKAYPDPLNVLMGVLRKGGGWYEQGYESPQDKAMRLFIEGEKERHEKRKQMEKETINLAFQKWQSDLSSEQLEKLVPPEHRSKETLVKGHLYRHFIDHVWPKMKGQLQLP